MAFYLQVRKCVIGANARGSAAMQVEREGLRNYAKVPGVWFATSS